MEAIFVICMFLIVVAVIIDVYFGAKAHILNIPQMKIYTQKDREDFMVFKNTLINGGCVCINDHEYTIDLDHDYFIDKTTKEKYELNIQSFKKIIE